MTFYADVLASSLALDRYAAPDENSVPVVVSRIAVIGARSAPSRYCQPVKGWPHEQRDIKGDPLTGSLSTPLTGDLAQ